MLSNKQCHEDTDQPLWWVLSAGGIDTVDQDVSQTVYIARSIIMVGVFFCDKSDSQQEQLASAAQAEASMSSSQQEYISFQAT